MNHALFIADLHLKTQGVVYQNFIEFLQNQIKGADALYILGDLFATWVGDDDRSALTEEIKAALKQASANGKPIYLQVGNRDFLLGENFVKAAGCVLIPDPFIIDLYGRKTLLTHGYDLCPKKILHTAMIKLLKTGSNLRRLFFALPKCVRNGILKFEHDLSYMFDHKTTQQLIDESQQEVVRMLAKYQVAQIIHGHLHQQYLVEFPINSGLARRIVLGNWAPNCSVLIYHANGDCEFAS